LASAAGRLLDALLVEVGGENLDGYVVGAFAREFREGHGDGVGFLARRAAHHPGSHRLVGRAMLDDPGKDFLLQDLEGFGVAEETGHVDQDVLIQVLHFRRVIAQILRVLIQPVQLVQNHASPDAAPQRVGLVQTEVDARRPSPQRQDFIEAVLVRELRRLFRAGFGDFGGGDVRMAADAREFFGDPFGREREVHAPGGDGAARHAVILGGFRFLR